MSFIGIDVSKAKLMCQATGANHALHAIMEGAGVYHEQAALALAVTPESHCPGFTT